jgi:hypothetical protein
MGYIGEPKLLFCFNAYTKFSIYLIHFVQKSRQEYLMI